jgi:hypothetical protein
MAGKAIKMHKIITLKKWDVEKTMEYNFNVMPKLFHGYQ